MLEGRLAEAACRADDAESKAMAKAEEYAKESVNRAQLHAGYEFTTSKKALEDEIDELKKFQQDQETQFKSFRESSDLIEQALGQARGYQGKVGEISKEHRKAQESAVLAQNLADELQGRVIRQEELINKLE